MIQKLIPKNELVKHTLTLMTGTVIAQALPLAVSPIITRIYGPEEFGVFALYMAIVSVVSVIATLRYEFAIMQPASEKDAYHIVLLCLIVSLLISFICFCFVLFFKDSICDYLNNQSIAPWLYFVPLSILIMGCFQSFNYWNNRNKKYRHIAQAKVLQSGATVSVNLTTSSTSIVAFGLIVGQLVGQMVSVVVLGLKFKKTQLKNISIYRMVSMAKRYSRFPLFSAPGALVNSLALQIPILFISKFYDLVAVGYFNFIYRIIGGPLSLISESLSQVLLQKITSKNYENLTGLVIGTAKKLFFIACPVVALVVLFGSEIFGFVFGEQWTVAGDYSKILIISIAIRFIVSPLSMVLLLDRFIKWAVSWQLYAFFSVLFTLLLFKELDFYDFLVVFVVQDVLSYMIYFGLILSASKKVAQIE